MTAAIWFNMYYKIRKRNQKEKRDENITGS